VNFVNPRGGKIVSIIEKLEELTSKAVLWTVLIECEAASGGKSWEIVLSDGHGRKGRGKGETLEIAGKAALLGLNINCGGQLRRYLD
jgi:hypothetical protein